MIRCLIERGRFVAPCEFDTQAQLDHFIALGKQEGDDQDRESEELAVLHNIPDADCLRLHFEYRDNFGRTESEKEWDRIDRQGEAPFSVCITTVYPESVLKNAPGNFIDKQARWNVSKAGNSSDVRAMRRLLHRAEQVRKNLPKVQSDELSDIDRRNQFIYDCAQDEKLSWADIAAQTKKKFSTMPVSVKAAGQAARDHRKKHGLDPIPKRKQKGRPPGSTPKLQDE